MTIPFNKWQRASNYAGEDYSDYYIIISRTRDSEAIQRSNFDTTRQLFEENNIQYTNPTFNHWAVGWIEAILIHQSNKDALQFAIEHIHEPLQDYPILNDMLWSEYEHEENTYYCPTCQKDTYHQENICTICNTED